MAPSVGGFRPRLALTLAQRLALYCIRARHEPGAPPLQGFSLPHAQAIARPVNDLRAAGALLLLPLLLLLLGACWLFPAPAFADDVEPDESVTGAPAWMTFYAHGDIAVDPGFRGDPELQGRLDRAVDRNGLRDLARAGKFSVAIVDLDDPTAPHLAEVDGRRMIYAASIPKIAVLYAAFQARKEGRLEIDAAFHETLTQMCRVSSNVAASAAIRKVGFPYIASVLWQSGLYDPRLGGGLWVGKAYGGANDYWHRDPVANLSHGATAVSLARLLTLLAQDKLVDAKSSAEMREILGNPGLHHKFVRGLDSRPSTICRKSGSWSQWHGDAALVQRDDRRYVAVALCESDEGQKILEGLILALDDCVGGCTLPASNASQPAAAAAL